VAVETAADRAVMLSSNDFGVVATYRRNTTNYSVVGIFDRAYLEVDVADVGYATTEPQFTMATADIPTGGVVGDKLTVNAIQYTITNIEPDGTGMSLLRLKAPT